MGSSRDVSDPLSFGPVCYPDCPSPLLPWVGGLLETRTGVVDSVPSRPLLPADRRHVNNPARKSLVYGHKFNKVDH